MTSPALIGSEGEDSYREGGGEEDHEGDGLAPPVLC